VHAYSGETSGDHRLTDMGIARQQAAPGRHRKASALGYKGASFPDKGRSYHRHAEVEDARQPVSRPGRTRAVPAVEFEVDGDCLGAALGEDRRDVAHPDVVDRGRHDLDLRAEAAKLRGADELRRRQQRHRLVLKLLLVCVVAHESVVSSMGDCLKCQTSAASPAEPGGLPW
jgi:hypothetical protein